MKHWEAASENCLPIHDIDLKQRALQTAQVQSFHKFSVSKHWITTFKHRHGIIARKITRFVIKHLVNGADERQQ